MHVYIYDEYINSRKYDNTIAHIETRITDLGLNGKIISLEVMKNVFDVVESEIKRGAKTIVAVGNDNTLNKIANAIVKTEIKNQMSVDVPLGMIPIGEKKNEISEILGIEKGITSCDALSSRRIEKIDIGKANNSFFLAHAKVDGQGTTIDMEKNYSIEIIDPGEINIINLPDNNPDKNIKSNPRDGKLELIINTKKKEKFLKSQISQSMFSIKKVHILNTKNKIILDNSIELQAPVEITVLKQKINILLGKKRNF
jgi:diacylglycerol kinase family enzyme